MDFLSRVAPDGVWIVVPAGRKGRLVSLKADGIELEALLHLLELQTD